MSFTPRTTAPDVLTNAYYRHTGYNNGLNECLLIDNITGAVMPNCVGYTWGRFYEVTGRRPSLSKADADQWYGHTQDGYERSRKRVAVGSVVCFSGGPHNSGHVCNVEEINYDANGKKILTCSNSAYEGSFFYITHLYESNNYLPSSAYQFQGFIINPDYPPPRPAKRKFKFMYYKRPL